jgi:uncharacterized 2Fe-2S/4Fe-4S cluster protein (DUF4445 family)
MIYSQIIGGKNLLLFLQKAKYGKKILKYQFSETSKMVSVIIHQGKKQIKVGISAGDTISAAIRKSGLHISMPCGGVGRCGKCAVSVSGSLDEPDQTEKAFMNDISEGMRLACRAAIRSDCEVFLADESAKVVETAYSTWTGDLNPIYGCGYGVALDIGTTTLAGQLFHHRQKKPLAVLGEMNAQNDYGADVLSRLVYCNEHTVLPLQNIIRNQIISMVERMCRELSITLADINALVIAGNSIMQCIFCGIEPAPLGLAPFTMPTGFGFEMDFMLEGLPNARIYISPCTSAYIGGDIICSVLASGIHHMPGNVLLLDIGTNGEIVLSKEGRLSCCSTAAGPAFEGANIKCGGCASAGAIDSVKSVDGRIIHTTIGNANASKICGSGLIDAIAVMLDCGILDTKGRISKLYDKFFIIPETQVYITQQDIRQVQLGKSAVRAGIDTLLHECCLSYNELDNIILCGGFGSYLRPESAERIGLLPHGGAAKTMAIGNAACNGAGQILQSKARKQEAEDVCDLMETVHLATNQFFIDRFLKVFSFD